MLRTQDKRLFLGEDLGAIMRKYRAGVVETVGTTMASSTGAILTGGVANTKGVYVQLTASTPFDADGFYIHLGNASTTRDFLLDIAIGAAASEVVIVPNIQVSSSSSGNSNVNAQVYCPIPIKAGTRIAARCQGSGGADVLVVQTRLVAGSRVRALQLARATTYGANTADSGGVQVDPGATIHTKGAWAEISAALTNPVEYLILCVGNRANAAHTGHNALFDLGIGAGGSEAVIADNLLVQTANTDDIVRPQWIEVPVAIPAGTRLAARAQCSINDATDRLHDVVVVGFD